MFRFIYLYILDKIDNDRTELFLFYIKNWDINKNLG